MREKELIKRIVKQLRASGAKVLKLHGDVFSEMGTPDLLGCYRGRALAIEVKVEGNETTEIQDRRLQEWSAAGALTTVAREDFDAGVFLAQCFGPVISLRALRLKTRTWIALRRNDVESVAQLTAMTENDVLSLRTVGKTAYRDIVERLAANGLKLKGE